MNESNQKMSTVKKKIFNVVAIIIALIGSNLITYYATGNLELTPEVQELIATLFPTIAGVTTGILAMMIKQGSFDKIFAKMLNDGAQVFVKSSTQVERIVNTSEKTNYNVKELINEYKQIKPAIKELLQIKDTVDTLNKKIDLLVTNTPELVKNGLASKIIGVNHDEK